LQVRRDVLPRQPFHLHQLHDGLGHSLRGSGAVSRASRGSGGHGRSRGGSVRRGRACLVHAQNADRVGKPLVQVRGPHQPCALAAGRRSEVYLALRCERRLGLRVQPRERRPRACGGEAPCFPSFPLETREGRGLSPRREEPNPLSRREGPLTARSPVVHDHSVRDVEGLRQLGGQQRHAERRERAPRFGALVHFSCARAQNSSALRDFGYLFPSIRTPKAKYA
jgi:hypothetical protein